VPRSHTNTKSIAKILRKNQRIGHQPSLAPGHQVEIGAGIRQPPRNSVVATAETLIMLTYSARKNIAQRRPEYSVWKPATSSPSASGRSKGARLVSPTIEMR